MNGNRLRLAGLMIVVSSAITLAQNAAHSALLTKGRLEADLGRHASAAAAFAALADDAGAPAMLRAEALARLGLAQSAGGDRSAAMATLTSVLIRYRGEPKAARFATGVVASGVPGKVWPEFRTQVEELLSSSAVTAVTDMGVAKSAPKRLRLQWDQFEVRAVWRANGTGTNGNHYSTERAAYDIDRMLQLDMVPPTVERAINGQPGAVQYWVNGVRVLTAKESPATEQWARQIARMKLFDSLLGNTGRGLGNMIVDPDDRLLLIDHIYAFSAERTLKDPPARFDRRLVEKLKALDNPDSRRMLQRVLGAAERDALLARRDLLLAHLARLVATQGDAAILF